MTMSDVNQWRPNMTQALRSMRKDNCKNVISPRNAISVNMDLSPGGSLMKCGTQELLSEQYPAPVRHDLKQLYVSLAELLRHFWACFSPMPPTTPQLQEKANKMYETLQKFQLVKLQPFKNELQRQYSFRSPITNHMEQMLEAANRKYTTWKKNAGRHAIG